MNASRKLFQAAARSFASASQRSSATALLATEGRTAALATLTNLGRKTEDPPQSPSPTPTARRKHGSHHASSGMGSLHCRRPRCSLHAPGPGALMLQCEGSMVAVYEN
ncbi:unnamed protein product [Urochloa humidicola]